MSNILHIDHVEVRYCQGDKSHVFGLLIHDNFEFCDVLDFENESDVPQVLKGIVEYCHKEYHSQALFLFDRCAEEKNTILLNNLEVPLQELIDALAENKDD